MATVKNYQDREKYIAYAKKVESEKGIPSNLLVGLLGAESAFREDIITGKKLSSAGAKGIAQFMKGTAKEYGIDPLNPYESIEAAGKYLTKSYKALGNWDDALRSYNMGVQGVKNVKSGKWKISKETADYVGRVYDNAKIFGEGINLPTQTYADKEPTNNLTNFEPMGQMRNFASVPDLKEEPKEVVVTETESTQKLKEQAFLEDYNRLIAQPQQQVAQQEEEVIPLMQDNTEEIFNDTSQFIDEGFAQEGGIIDDNEGQWKYPGEVTRISSPNITMKNVPYPVLGVADTGEQKMMYPEMDYTFKGAKTVTEYPDLTEKEKQFLKALKNDRTRIHN